MSILQYTWFSGQQNRKSFTAFGICIQNHLFHLPPSPHIALELHHPLPWTEASHWSPCSLRWVLLQSNHNEITKVTLLKHNSDCVTTSQNPALAPILLWETSSYQSTNKTLYTLALAISLTSYPTPPPTAYSITSPLLSLEVSP